MTKAEFDFQRETGQLIITSMSDDRPILTDSQSGYIRDFIITSRNIEQTEKEIEKLKVLLERDQSHLDTARKNILNTICSGYYVFENSSKLLHVWREPAKDESILSTLTVPRMEILKIDGKVTL